MRTVAEEGVNCWRRVQADRLALLSDAAAYYEALVVALERARRSVLVLGWDIDSRVALRRGPHAGAPATDLRSLLNRVVAENGELVVRLLSWDSSLLFSFEREWGLWINLGLRTLDRVHFKLDNHHPTGASHHQKLVVVDDRLAFVGGIDLTGHRWDTPRHAPDDRRRVTAAGEPFGPFHDLQLAVDGAVAGALGDLARDRWRRATDQRLGPADVTSDPWPGHLRADLERVQVAIARTEPAHDGRPAVREVERMYLDAIDSARRCIYLENQYLTASSICDALARRLAEDGGPEVVIVGPRQASGWLETSTMDVLRARVLDKLRRADRHGRLRVYYPVLGGPDRDIYIHSKAMVMDDRLLRVGSANLSNRSMGLDTECDLIAEADGQPGAAEAIIGFRDRLLAEHLGRQPGEVGAAVRREGSLVAALDRLRGGRDRDLLPLEPEVPAWIDRAVPEAPPFDPPRPLDADQLLEQLVPREIKRGSRRPLLRGALLLAGLLLLAAAWRWTPLADWVDPRSLARWAEPIMGTVFEPLVVVAAFLVGALVLFPQTLLVVYAAMVFGPWAGFAYSLLGSLLGGCVGFGLGRWLGRGAVKNLAGSRISRIGRQLARGGVLGVLAVRVLPVAPFSVVNLVIGASSLTLWEFLLGTLLGMAPGVLALTVLGDRVSAALRDPGAASVALLMAAALVIVGAALLLHRRFGRREASQE